MTGPIEMEAVSGFLNMGGYAPFVWPSYGIAAIILIGLFLRGLKFQQSSMAELKGKEPFQLRKPNSNNLESDDKT